MSVWSARLLVGLCLRAGLTSPTCAQLTIRGQEHAAFFREHNFGTVPFEWLGLYGIADRHIELIVHGGSGRT